MTLKFWPKQHKYKLDGQPIPGVTTLIGKGLPKPAIPYWAAKMVAEYVIDNPEGVETLRDMGRGPAVAALKGVPWQKRDEAAIRGTDVHAIAEQVIHGDEVEVPSHLAAHVDGYVSFLDEWAIEPILTERSVASRKWWYAGRFDAIVKLDGAVTLMDIKTSKGVYGETALQCAAYANADLYVDDDDPEAEHELPAVERIAVAHVTDEGTTLHDLGDIDRAFQIFSHVQWVAKRTDDIKTFLSEPLTRQEQTA